MSIGWWLLLLHGWWLSVHSLRCLHSVLLLHRLLRLHAVGWLTVGRLLHSVGTLQRRRLSHSWLLSHRSSGKSTVTPKVPLLSAGQHHGSRCRGRSVHDRLLWFRSFLRLLHVGKRCCSIGRSWRRGGYIERILCRFTALA